jgi:hypothetical protein
MGIMLNIFAIGVQSGLGRGVDESPARVVEL